jgi:hypothetical protein
VGELAVEIELVVLAQIELEQGGGFLEDPAAGGLFLLCFRGGVGAAGRLDFGKAFNAGTANRFWRQRGWRYA